jgi:hypothetical protein
LRAGLALFAVLPDFFREADRRPAARARRAMTAERRVFLALRFAMTDGPFLDVYL